MHLKVPLEESLRSVVMAIMESLLVGIALGPWDSTVAFHSWCSTARWSTFRSNPTTSVGGLASTERSLTINRSNSYRVVLHDDS